MMNLTTDKKYKYLEDPSELAELHEKTQKSGYRQAYHVQAVTGLINDPNGFSFFDGRWHLFYQWCPWGAVHGLKYWYHVVSEDLVNWRNLGIGLSPDEAYIYDNKGVYSGSGLPVGNELYLYYTGNNRDAEYIRHPYTCLAKMDKSGKIEKAAEPLFSEHPDYTEHQRDPKIVAFPDEEKYYIIIGTRTKDERGCILIYEATEPARGFRFKGELSVPGYENFGGMWECPSIECMVDKDVLIFCPQYLKLPGRGDGTNQNVYIVGKMDWENLTFTPAGDFHVLDEGFDFYAAACANNTKDDRTILSAWMGLPDAAYPTDEEDWSGCLTVPRELSVKGDRLIKKPIRELVSLREKEFDIGKGEIFKIPDACEILMDVSSDSLLLRLFADENGEGGLLVAYDKAKKTLTVDRGHMKNVFNEKEGFVRTGELSDDLFSLRIFIDHSSLEIFANDGELSFTSRVFPADEEHFFNLNEGSVDVKGWLLKTSVDTKLVV